MMKGSGRSGGPRATARRSAPAAIVAGLACALALVGSGGRAVAADTAEPTDAEITALMKASFRERGIAKLDRLEQTEIQAACSAYATKPMPADVKSRLEQAAQATIRYPADGKYLGDFRAGERIAQSGVGMQFSDNEKTINGGNCYACHQLSKAELAFGNIGPSLYQYGKVRGDSEAILKYTWGRLWNSHAFNACNQMPRYGAAGILTETQLRDVMALLLDPKSPVNQ